MIRKAEEGGLSSSSKLYQKIGIFITILKSNSRNYSLYFSLFREKFQNQKRKVMIIFISQVPYFQQSIKKVINK